jgi:hypothetical protein
MSGLVVLHKFNSRGEAEVAKGFLESHKIKAYVVDESIGGVSPATFLSGVGLKVYQEDFQKAKELLEHNK